MVVAVTPLSIGNALRITLAPPAGSKLWSLLRNTTGIFAGPTDANSVLVAQTNEEVIYDSIGLANGTQYFYQAFYFDGLGGVTTDDVSASGTPGANYFDDSTDALTLLRERLDVGIQNEIAAGRLTPGENAGGVIKVLTAPPVFEQTQFPVVLVHLTSESPGEHGIGELIEQDIQDAGGQWNETEGWIANTVISVVGWCRNPDDRIAMRKALRRLVIGNLQVFNAAGLREVEFSQNDTEELTGQYGAPVYWAECSFSCESPLIVGGKLPTIAGVTVTADIQIPNSKGSISSAGSSLQ
jgi:hypothetical protein